MKHDHYPPEKNNALAPYKNLGRKIYIIICVTSKPLPKAGRIKACIILARTTIGGPRAGATAVRTAQGAAITPPPVLLLHPGCRMNFEAPSWTKLSFRDKKLSHMDPFPTKYYQKHKMMIPQRWNVPFFHGASCPFVSSGSSEIKRVQNKREIILYS